MGAYCDFDDVRGLLPNWLVIDNESQPSSDEATTIVDNVAAEIDGVLAAATYTVPITDAGSIRLLRHYNTLGAAYQIWYAAVKGQTDDTAAKTWREDYQTFLSRIRRGEQELPGVSKPVDSPRKPYFQVF